MFPALETARSVGTRWDGHFSEEFITEGFLSADHSLMDSCWSCEARSASPTWELLGEVRSLGRAASNKMGDGACEPLNKNRINRKSQYPPAQFDSTRQYLGWIITSIQFCTRSSGALRGSLP